ncbi:MAG: cytochrome d ubiquinol oxidase subunit II, partial [Bacteroidales bacterium]|nr:cytochrome d ubiquinol oxidase subunit II [Bacteroidales bacterium]
LPLNAAIFLACFLFFLVSLLVTGGFAIDATSGAIVTEKLKYLRNFLAMPLVLVLFLAGVTGVVYGIASAVFGKGTGGIWFSGAGTILAVLSLFMVAGFNSTPYYPSSYDPASSLTIMNSSSSLFTLKTMMYVSFIIPFVLVYIWFAWKAINVSKITEEEMGKEGHVY